MCPLLLNGKDLREIIPELKYLTFHQPRRLSDIFNTTGLRLSENIHIRAFGNKPYITVFIYELKNGFITKSKTITPIDFLNNTYLAYGLSPSLITLINEINVKYCSDLKLRKQEPIKQFRIIKQEEVKPYLMLMCPKTQQYQKPFNCQSCFYFVELMTNESVVCQYVPFDQSTKLKPHMIKPAPQKHLTSKKSYTVLKPKTK
jgi:hypothetical protein